jgi:hypothetical protein
MFDLNTAKARLNITGALQDAEVQGMLDAALALAERYCNRGFLYRAERVNFYDTTAGSLPMPRYPIDVVTKTNAIGRYHIMKSAGTILIHDRNWWHGREITIEYAGGYRTLPADLELALWEVFANLWGRHSASLTGAAAATGSGAIQSITSDGATIRYDTSGSAGAATQGAVDPETGFPYSALSILDLYRREVA